MERPETATLVILNIWVWLLACSACYALCPTFHKALMLGWWLVVAAAGGSIAGQLLLHQMLRGRMLSSWLRTALFAIPVLVTVLPVAGVFVLLGPSAKPGYDPTVSGTAPAQQENIRAMLQVDTPA